MQKCELEVGDIVQLNPEGNGKFGGKFLVVTEPKYFGCQGYILWDDVSNVEGVVTAGGKAFLRPKFERFEFIGKAAWLRVEDKNKEEEDV